MLETGTAAPDFTIPNQDGEDVTLSALKGRPVVLYFYPKADTPGCTTQACSVRDHAEDYAKHDAVVLGVSPDPVKKVKKFHEKHDMGFTLLADEDHAVAEQYEVWAEKSMYGRTYWGNLRATYVIDADGTIAAVFPKVSPKTHDDVVLKALDELAASDLTAIRAMVGRMATIDGLDFLGVPTQDPERARAFYRDVLGMRPDEHADWEQWSGSTCFAIWEPEKQGMPFVPQQGNPWPLRCDDVPATRAALEAKGVVFFGDTFDTGVCHMAIFSDPDGNQLMLHHRYAPYEDRS